MEAIKKERSFYIDNVKSVLIFFVVIAHFAEVAISHSDIFKSMFLWLYSFHMPLFIFITGYLSKNTISNKEKTKKRIIEYFFLYFLLNFVLFIGKALDREKSSFNLFDETGVPWYLLSVAIMYLISFLLQNYNQKTIFIFAIVLALFTGYDKEIGDWFALSRTIVFFPFFLIGQNVNEDILFNLTTNKKIKFCSIIIILFSILIYFVFPDKIMLLRPLLTGRNAYSSLNDSIEFWGPALRLIVYLIAIILSVAILSIIPKCNLRYFSEIGRRTLPIYFFHRVILYSFSGLNIYGILQSKAGTFFDNFIWLVLAVFCTIILSLPIFEKPFVLWNKVLYKNK